MVTTHGGSIILLFNYLLRENILSFVLNVGAIPWHYKIKILT